MAAVEVPQTLEYRGGQLNAAPVLEVENFTNWKKRFLCHIIGIEPQFENIIKNGPFIPMTAGQRKPENQWTGDERKAANLDQRLKSLIMSVLPDDQMNSVINCLTAKSTWDDLILYHEGPSDVKESRVMDLKLCYNTFKFKEGLKIVLMMKRIQIIQQRVSRNLEEEYQARALLAKSKRFFKKSTQRFSSTKANDQTECHECGKKGHFARDCWSKTSVSTYQSPFQLKPLISPQHKPELRPTKDFEAKYNKAKAKLALLSSSASASKAPMVKNKCLITEAYEWEQEVSSDDNEMVEVKVLMALAEENNVVGKESARKRNDHNPIPVTERPWLSEAKGFILPNHDTGRILPAESQRNTTNPLVSFNDPSTTDYDSAYESSVFSTPLPPFKKLEGVEPIFGPKTIKSISNYDHDTNGYNRTIYLERGINIINPQHAFKRCEACGSSNHTTTNHYDIEWFKSGKALQAKKAKALKSTKAESSNANRSKTPTKSGCSRHMTGVKSYLHKYMEQPGPKVVFGDDSTCITEGYDSIKCNGISDEKRGTTFNYNKEIVMIAPRVRDVYVLDMTSFAQESCFFAKATKNLNWLWHKILAH
ncbi:retrovirus-related pol polyprotein from transposon TNT 1-94 [Tanacetum coccineum]